MKYEPINPELFQYNRRRFARKMQPDSIAIFFSNDLMPRNGDTFYAFRQNSDLFYLSGLDQEETVIVLFPDCVKDGFHELAFIKRPDAFTQQWEGQKYSKEEASAISGIKKIFWRDEMDGILHELILLAKRIYLNLNENERFIPEVPSHNRRMAEMLMRRYPLHKYHRSAPLLKKLAMIKAPAEIELIGKALDITNHAYRRVLDFVRPGLGEYEIEAEITHEFIRRQAGGHAYPPIVASGPDTCVMHYSRNNKICRDGDLVLLDFGAEYANYAADLSRTLPVNGVFTKRQREIYEAVLRILRAAAQMLVPGNTLEDYQREVGKMMESELLELKLLDKTDIKNQDTDFPAYRQYFMHSVSHHIGLDVHDRSHFYDPIQAGMVFTCEPGIYVKEEGAGIRLENIILVTDQGPVDLTQNVLIEPEAIEEVMNAKEVGV